MCRSGLRNFVDSLVVVGQIVLRSKPKTRFRGPEKKHIGRIRCREIGRCGFTLVLGKEALTNWLAGNCKDDWRYGNVKMSNWERVEEDNWKIIYKTSENDLYPKETTAIFAVRKSRSEGSKKWV
jgi:hypothetical protein